MDDTAPSHTSPSTPTTLSMNRSRSQNQYLYIATAGRIVVTYGNFAGRTNPLTT